MLGGAIVGGSMKRISRKPSKLSESLQRHLNAYAMAANAAGVGVLAWAHPAEAEIVYTPAHNYVRLNSQLGIDLNHDGLTDAFVGRHLTSFFSTRYKTSLLVHADSTPSHGIAGYLIVSAHHVSALHAGQKIGSGLQFLSYGTMANRVREIGHREGSCFGGWNNVTKRYLGVKFLDRNQEEHYGWARFSEWCNPNGEKGTGARALLTGYAYETIPNKPIIAGKVKGPDVITLEPASLGALAAGASGRHRVEK